MKTYTNETLKNLTIGQVSDLTFIDVWFGYIKGEKFKENSDFYYTLCGNYVFIVPLKKNPLRDLNLVLHILPYCTLSCSQTPYLQRYRDEFKPINGIKVYAVKKDSKISELWERHYWMRQCFTFWLSKEDEEFIPRFLHSTTIEETDKKTGKPIEIKSTFDCLIDEFSLVYKTIIKDLKDNKDCC